MKYYLIDGDQLDVIRRASRKLHTERRMNGDEMRDMGHSLAWVADTCAQLEVPEDHPTTPTKD